MVCSFIVPYEKNQIEKIMNLHSKIRSYAPKEMKRKAYIVTVNPNYNRMLSSLSDHMN